MAGDKAELFLNPTSPPQSRRGSSSMSPPDDTDPNHNHKHNHKNETAKPSDQQISWYPLEIMTSRRPTSAVTSQLQQPSQSSAAAGEAQTDSQLAAAGVVREDTPIIHSGTSTPRSYQSTTGNENATSNNDSSGSSRRGNGYNSHGGGTGGGGDAREDDRNGRNDVLLSSNAPQQGEGEGRTQQYSRPNGRDQNGSLDELAGADEDRPWYKKAAEKYGSLELENKGSVARDHLALERTFLAWLRTSLAFASIGIAITQLFRLNTSISPQPPNQLSSSSSASSNSIDDQSSPFAPILPPKDHSSFLSAIAPPTATSADFERLRSLGKPLGATFIGIAIVVLLVGFHRYFESQYWVVRGKFPASRSSIALVAFFTCALMVTSLVVILAIAPGAFEA